MPSAVDLGIADHGEGASREQVAHNSDRLACLFFCRRLRHRWRQSRLARAAAAVRTA
jgi:hypothetical protein